MTTTYSTQTLTKLASRNQTNGLDNILSFLLQEIENKVDKADGKSLMADEILNNIVLKNSQISELTWSSTNW